MAAHQAPPSLGFSRQEHWSGLPFPSPMHESESEVAQSCPTLRNPMDCSPPSSSIHGIFQARVLEWGAIAFSHIPHNAYLYLSSITTGISTSLSIDFCFLLTEQPPQQWVCPIPAVLAREFLNHTSLESITRQIHFCLSCLYSVPLKQL